MAAATKKNVPEQYDTYQYDGTGTRERPTCEEESGRVLIVMWDEDSRGHIHRLRVDATIVGGEQEFQNNYVKINQQKTTWGPMLTYPTIKNAIKAFKMTIIFYIEDYNKLDG
jgi:hypothetical protein